MYSSHLEKVINEKVHKLMKIKLSEKEQKEKIKNPINFFMGI